MPKYPDGHQIHNIAQESHLKKISSVFIRDNLINVRLENFPQRLAKNDLLTNILSSNRFKLFNTVKMKHMACLLISPSNTAPCTTSYYGQQDSVCPLLGGSHQESFVVSYFSKQSKNPGANNNANHSHLFFPSYF